MNLQARDTFTLSRENNKVHEQFFLNLGSDDDGSKIRPQKTRLSYLYRVQ